MKILIVHMRYFPDKTGTAPLVTQLAQSLVVHGPKVSVITSLTHYGRLSVDPDYLDFKGFFRSSEEFGVEIIRTRVYVPQGTGFMQRVWNYVTYNFLSVIAGIKADRADVILAVNPPITTTFAAWIVSLFHRAPLIIGIQDVWPDCIIQVNKLKNRILIFFSRILEKIQYRIANKVIVLSPGMQSNLERKGVDLEKIEIIANWADTDLVTPLPRENDFSHNHELRDKFVVLFAGNHGYIAALDNIILTAEILQETPDILFLFVGEGSVKGELIQYADEIGLENVRFLTTQPEQEWLEMLAAADLALVSLRADLAELNVPSKVYTLMSAARPILASVPEDSEVASLVLSAKSGIICTPEDPDALANSILEMKNSPDLLDEFGRNGRNYLLEKSNRKLQTKKYFSVLKDCLD